jgi:putative endonuclease
MTKTNKQKVGEVGEDIACRFLLKRDFEIVERNYLKKWGEIDIIAKEKNIIHFVEVKTVSHLHQEVESDGCRPEDNIHPWKLKRLSKTIQTYLLEKELTDDIKWHFDAIIVFLDQQEKIAKVRFLEDIIL